MSGKSGPFQIIEDEGVGNLDSPIAAPHRRHACPNYDTCLNLAAALNWDSFGCHGCNGQIDERHLWRAKQALKHDLIADTLCKIPEIHYIGNDHVATSQGAAVEFPSTTSNSIALKR